MKELLLLILLLMLTGIYIWVFIFSENKLLQNGITGFFFGWFLTDIKKIIREW